MKWIKVFSVFVLLHLVAWAGAHWYKQNNPEEALIVADTSFALKPHFSQMQDWIDSFAQDSRYRKVTVGTDKALIGELTDLKSTDSIFRVSFGRSTDESLKQYESERADERIFLSDGSFSPSGWTLIRFPR